MTQIRPFSVDEARPILDVVSKFGHIKVVDASPHMKFGWPYICWLDNNPHPYVGDFYQYPGRGMWMITSDLPRICLVVEADVNKGESPFVISKAQLDKADKVTIQAEITKVANSMKSMNIPTPWRENPFIDPDEFRQEIVAEIPKVAAYLDTTADFKDKPTRGVEVSHDSLELSGIEDRDGSGEGVLLVSDLDKFKTQQGPTSPYDQALHFWITVEDEGKLYDALVKIGGSAKLAERDWPMLYRISQSQFGAEFTQDEVGLLQNETSRFSKSSNAAGLRDAMDALTSICKSANAYNLAIYVPGE